MYRGCIFCRYENVGFCPGRRANTYPVNADHILLRKTFRNRDGGNARTTRRKFILVSYRRQPWGTACTVYTPNGR
jgi:hypothetical protein